MKYYVSLWESDYSSTGVPTLLEDKVPMVDFNKQTENVYEKHIQHMVSTGLSHLTFRERDSNKQVELKITKQ